MTESRAVQAPYAPLAQLTAVLADNKYFLGRRLSEWGIGALGLESAVACMAIAQEELGHARGLYSMLEGFPTGSAPAALDRDDDRAERYCVSFVLDETRSWYDAVVALVLLDGAMTTVLEAARESSVEDLRKRAQRILGDEDFHWKYTVGRVRELQSSEAEAEVLEQRIAMRLPEVLCWFGPPGELAMQELVSDGVLARDGAAMRAAFLDRLDQLTIATGLRLPVRRLADGSWEHGELPWDEWNAQGRRLGTSPNPTSTPAHGATRSASSGSASTAQAS